MDETKKCPCCGNILIYMIPRIGMVAGYVCTSAGCLFRCNAKHYEKLCNAMNAQAELDALKAAVMPVVDWWKEVKPSHCTAKWPDFYVLEYGGKNISLRQLELLENALEDECKR